MENHALGIDDFQNILSKNKGITVFKFGADWCNPCKKVEPLFQNFSNTAPQNVQCIKIDVDESFELYANMKRMKMVKGLPTFLAYYEGNVSFAADDSTVGSDTNELNLFFQRVIHRSKNE